MEKNTARNTCPWPNILVNHTLETQLLPTDEPDTLRTAIRTAVDLLAAGEVVALPTETVYGLAGDAFDAAAVAKIFEAKERPSFDPLIVHLPHKDRLADVAIVPDEIAPTIRKLIELFWPGPLTLVLPKHPNVPDIVTAGLPTVAVRMSAHPIFRRIVTSVAKPLAAPSANRFGRISPTSANAVLQELHGRIPAIVDAGACLHGLESTILKVEPGPKKPLFHVLRAGPITREDLIEHGKVIFANKKAASADKPEVPGQLPSHYAPRTPLTLVENPDEWEPVEGKRYALLSYSGDAKAGLLEKADWEEVMMLSPGNGKLSEAAVRLFYCLRELDRRGFDEIIAEPCSEVGIGVAIMERLRRASVKH
jgi:L-threonylcarbamoyladenylate synthase